jgi:hypothetical protein
MLRTQQSVLNGRTVLENLYFMPPGFLCSTVR